MFKGAGVSVEGGCFEAKLSSGFAPARNSRANYTEDLLCLRSFESKARRCSERAGYGWFFLIFGD
ncbi:MAG TPA: hypothetical protein PKK20_04675 [Verrucomicrobiota bacterium]|nr:hypothetical protein [Verrucomicrobiota bacterium]